MKALVTVWIFSCLHHMLQAKVIMETSQKLYEQQPHQYQFNKQINSFRPISETQENGDPFQFDIDGQSNEISKGSKYPSYQPLKSEPSTPPPSTLSTHLKQISSSPATSYTPLVNVNSPTPVIMQYMPENIPGTGIQYLQLIPTRPLIVPISPFLTTNAESFSPISAPFPPPIHSTLQSIPSGSQFSPSIAPFKPSMPPPYHLSQPSIRPFPRGVPLMPPAPSVSTPTPTASYRHSKNLFNSSQRSSAGISLAQSSSTSFSPGSYLSPNYEFIRPNTGLNLIESPNGLNLNTNEYMPSYGKHSFGGARPAGQ